ncbi:MAG: phenylalanine--tRNA ligase subunit alpha [Aaplasma endosymbiont of Hyalomma asiaticum]
MQNSIRKLGEEARSLLSACGSLRELEELRTRYFGKSGALTVLLKKISGLQSISERRAVGSFANSLCAEIKELLKERESAFVKELLEEELRKDGIDVTLPSRCRVYGKLHPVSKTLDDIKVILAKLGFRVVLGPDLEDEFHVFDALNAPAHHPARDKNDTFYMKQELNGCKVLLRPHTSSVQIRTMLKNSGSFPIKIISPGKVYRNDWDSTHSPMFHQVEGLFVDENVNMGHLKYCINHFLEMFFDRKIESRLRASFFPFTEPSVEVDIRDNKNRWIEVLGCGIVHPKVLENVGIDPNKFSGFAFGMGVERMAMLKYDIADLRSLYSSKLDWLHHYGFCFTDLVK